MKNDFNYEMLLNAVKTYSLEYIEGLDNMPAYPGEDSIAGLDNFREDLPEKSQDPMKVLEMLNTYGAPGTCASGGGRQFGFVQGGLLPVAHGAQWLVDTWNQNAGLYAMSPAASVIEEVAEGWISDLFGFPKGSAMGLVTGSANGLMTCFIAARNELMKRQGWNVKVKGFRNAPPMRVVLSEDAHGTVKDALFNLGFGREELEFVPVDKLGRMIPEKVPHLDEKTLFILQAGHIVGGSFDPIDELADLGRAAGAWIHVDGAFGLWAAVSEKQKHLVIGLDKVDSCNMDAHKTLNAGYDNSIILCRHRDALESALALQGSYIKEDSEKDPKFKLPPRNGSSYTTEMSRRARGIVLWAVLKQLGREGLAEMIDQMCECTSYFADKLKEIGYDVPNPPFFNQFFFKLPTDEETLAALGHLQSSGITWMGGAKWKGADVIRISISSVNITRDSIDSCLPAFEKALHLDS